jgi:outer membrane protein TolC
MSTELMPIFSKENWAEMTRLEFSPLKRKKLSIGFFCRVLAVSISSTGFVYADENVPANGEVKETLIEQEQAVSVTASDLANILRSHPSYIASEEAFCTRVFGVNVSRSTYFPKLSLSLSSGDKMVDKTTRSDEFGGVNSPEYDGKGTDATLVLRQLVYDWGVTPRDIKISSGKALRANLERYQVLNTVLSQMLQLVFDYDRFAYSVSRFEELVTLTDELVKNAETKYKRGSGTLTEVKELRLHMLERETRLKSARLDLGLAEKNLTKVYGISVDIASGVKAHYLQHRLEFPKTGDFTKSLAHRLNLRDINNAETELAKITRSRFPKIEAEITGRAWDLQEEQDCGDVIGTSSLGSPQRILNDCTSSEVTGRLLLTMPLYDGGEKTNQHRVVRSELKQFRATQNASRRDYDRQSAEYIRQIADFSRRDSELTDQREALVSRISDLRRLQSLTQADIALISTLIARQIDLEVEIRNNKNSLEIARAQILDLNDSIRDTLGLNFKKPECEF